ncbi:MAG: class I SAM-dependent methyltransferase [Chloroflexota bacterium]|nr:class I SAM-dependent methyltransferase [Chloroflexota bacterium]
MDLKQALAYTEDIISGVTATEASMLYDLAVEVHSQGLGSVVEVGAYTGKSTIILSAAGPVYSIDHHRGNAEHQPGQARCRSGTLIEERVDTFPIFKTNLSRAGLWSQTTAIVTDHITALQLLPSKAIPIALLFADADHSEFGTWLLIECWRNKVRGVMAFHDYCEDFPGVVAAVDRANFGPPLFKVDSLIGFRVGK